MELLNKLGYLSLNKAQQDLHKARVHIGMSFFATHALEQGVSGCYHKSARTRNVDSTIMLHVGGVPIDGGLPVYCL